jgi:hypothetical protein
MAYECKNIPPEVLKGLDEAWALMVPIMPNSMCALVGTNLVECRYLADSDDTIRTAWPSGLDMYQRGLIKKTLELRFQVVLRDRRE